ncbi:MAG: bacillithiol biosynthesis cysteine-adding enzyme BshC [Flavihumibacter sp.]
MMEGSACSYTYDHTGYFNTIVTDYVHAAPALRPFYRHPVSPDGIKAAIHAREQFATDRQLLTTVLKDQYAQAGLQGHLLVDAQIELLAKPTTFSICTAHQPNIFTGYLYFVYKVLHIVKMAAELKKEHPQYDFVPVYYMGSEDADLEELGKVFLNGEKLVWETRQTGAVGRMKPKGLELLIERIGGELSVQPYGKELVALLKTAYIGAPDIQTATFRLLHALFARFGVVVLIADEPRLKRRMLPVFTDDLFAQQPSSIVRKTTAALAKNYKVQANPRAINLFYLKNDVRNRIEKTGEEWVVVDTGIRFDEAALRRELEDHPERFSPNVILRGLYQETILPNIVFVGGGGELAYWLELADLFRAYEVPYPVQVLRNSFLLIEPKAAELQKKTGIDTDDLFKKEEQLLNELVKRDSAVQIHLSNEIRDAGAFYSHVQGIAGKVDSTLVPHVESLQKRMLHQLQELEKKMLRAEKRKFSDQSRQLARLKALTFPKGNLQERTENFMPFYATYGPDFLQWIYDASLTFGQRFVVLSIPVLPTC